MLEILVPIAASSAGGAVVGALLNKWWDRLAAKKEPKTVMRAKAYEDFVVHFVGSGNQPGGSDNSPVQPDLSSVKARLALFGESAVVVAAAKFTSLHNSLGTAEAKHAFVQVVREMRESLLTGSGSEVSEGIEKLLEPPANAA